MGDTPSEDGEEPGGGHDDPCEVLCRPTRSAEKGAKGAREADRGEEEEGAITDEAERSGLVDEQKGKDGDEGENGEDDGCLDKSTQAERSTRRNRTDSPEQHRARQRVVHLSPVPK